MKQLILASVSVTALLAAAPAFSDGARASMSPALTVSGIDGAALDAIPVISHPLSLLRLSTAKATTMFARAALRAVAPKATSSQRSATAAMGFVENGRVAGYVGPTGTDAEIFPQLEGLAAGAPEAAVARQRAEDVFTRSDIVPKDDTTASLAAPITLYRGFAQSRLQAGAPAESVVAYVSAKRQVDGMPVFGTGSRASVGFGHDGSVQALVKHWRAAVKVGVVDASRSQAEIRAAIVAQLSGFVSATTHVTVDRVGIGYYDGNKDFLQPVYYFTARLLPRGGAGRVLSDGDAVVGYVPIGAPAESVPDLSVKARAAGGAAASASGSGSLGYISLGEYVVRNDDANWLANANEFYGGLQDGGNALFAPNVDPIPFNRDQFYWAQPFEYLANGNSYMNSVQLADTEAHGDWWLYTTYQNWGDIVNVSDIGTGGNPAYGGYGTGTNSHLAHWMIHSCEVIPSMFDLQIATGNYWDAFTPWWSVFNGLHNVAGYRTIMFIDDDTGYPFGYSLGLGGQFTQSWFNAVASAPDYNQGWTYFSSHLNRNVPYGEPSVMSIPGLENDSVYATQPAYPAVQTGLYNFYLVGATD